MICYFPINNDYSKKERDGQDDKKYHDKSLYISYNLNIIFYSQ